MNYLFAWKKIKIEKIKKLLAKLHDKNEYVMHLRNLKQVLYYGLVSVKTGTQSDWI